MKTKEVTGLCRLENWAAVMEDRRASGLSVREYCEGTGIRKSSYYYWQRKLREAVNAEMKQGNDVTASIDTLEFVEVQLAAQPAPAATQVSTHWSQVCIESGDVRITACSEYPADKLATLLREVAWQ